ncbi:MAG: FtsH protease activity modulator HflK [Desulfomonilaceae bacterium]|nr:FtsH protease activity modulator HflK [Desulfomonilaceae bacterium]
MDQFRPRNDENPVREIQRGVEDLKSLLEGFFKGRGTWIVIIILVLLYLASGFYVVQPGEKGVELLFGKVKTITDPGLRYRLPKPFMDALVVDIAQIRRAEIGFRSDGARSRSVPPEALMLTGDENIVDVQLFVQYVINDPVKFLFGAQAPETALRASAEVALRGVVGENEIDYTMTSGRMDVQQKVQAYLQRLLDTYNTGLLATEARLLVVDPPAQVQEAFHDVVRAWEDRERLIKEAEGYQEDVIPRARGMAREEIRKAEGFKAQRVIRAKGDAQRFDRVLEEYLKAPEVTRERLYLESAEKFLPEARKFIMEGGDSRVLPLFPLTQPTGPAGKRSEPRRIEPSSEKKGD